MFEQLNMTNKLKRQISKVVSIALCAAMLVTALPADLLGGVASVKAAPIAEEELLDIGAAVTAGTLKVQDYTADVTVGNFKIHALNGMSEGDNPKNNQQVTIDANGKKIDGYNFTHRLKMNGAGQSTYRSIEFTTNGAAKVKVYGMSSSKNNVRHLTLIDSDDKVTTDSEGNDGNNISATEFSITSAGTYYISCDAAYNIYGVKVTPTTTTPTKPTVSDGDVSDGDVSDGDVSDGDPNPKPEELGTTDGLDPGSVGDRTWTFPVKAEDAYDQSAKTGVKYEGDAGNYRGLKVDAKTVSGAKFQVRGSDVLINAGTIVQVPVDGDCEITVVAYDAGYAEKYTVSLEETNTTGKVENVKTDGATRDFTYTGAKGYVNIVPTAQTYLKSIAVKHTAAENPGDEKPDADGFYNGFNAKNAVKGRSYVFDFTDKENLGSDAFGSDEKTLVDISKGLFAYKKAGSGSYYHTPKYGVEFQSPSTLTFDVAGNSYIVVGGDDNSNATLTASTTSGEVSPETLSSKTAGHAELADCKAQGENTLVYKYTGGEGQVTLTVDALENGSAGKAYIAYVCVIPKLTVTLDSTKPDVWDFGAMEVKGANNLLTVDAINGLYPEGTKAGATGVTISTFEAKDSNDVVAIKFVTGGKNHRIRTTNTAITRFDAKSLKGANDTVYNGYFYSNNESNLDKVANSLNGTEAGTTNQADHLDIYLYEGDTLTCLLGSNGNTALYKLYNPDNEEYAEFGYTATYGVEAAVFHAADEGWYKLYCTNEKLVCARITREHAPKVAVSGSIDVTKAEGIPDGYGVIYTNVETGYKTAMTVADGKYTGTVSGGYSYKVSLKDANGYVVRGGKDLAVGTDKETIENNLTVETVVQKTITGKVKGLTEAELAKVKFVFEVPAEYVFEPQITLTGDSYTLKVEDGVTYKVTALDVNDSTLKTTEVSAKDTDKTADIEFEKKTTYAVTLKITGVEDSSNAVATFTNVDEKYTDGKTPYTYTFKVSDGITLRDGRYSVKVAGLGNYAVTQGVTPNVNVNGAAISDAPVPFSNHSTWDFAKMKDVFDIETIGGVNYYAGLVLTPTEPDKDGKVSNVGKNKTYLLGNSGTKVTVPGLKVGDRVTITYCYTAAFTLDEGDTAGTEVYGTGSGSTNTFESIVYTMKTDNDLVISNTTGKFKYMAKEKQEDGTEVEVEKERDVSQTYLCSIDVLAKADQVPYTATITVGKDKTYKTINEALAAVRKMIRTDDENVTIMIDPGDYEEMLVLDTPNVTLKNASATPSIKLKDKGVNIDDNAVRVTWYYGHGYTYYSMDTDCKYNADLLAANKLNGYASFKNPGSGTTNGSYWNATVVVTADKVSAEDIIFENSFNQYMSKKAAEDKIEKQSGAKEGSVTRVSMAAGDTTVQNKAYVERAAALAIYDDKKEISFDNCKFIGRQDTLYGGAGVTAAFYNCSVYGGTDYIFGGMTAVFAKCDLVFNTSEDNNDVGYITAAQQKSGRGYLMYNCTVTSTTPGEDTASKYPSKAGYLGRPWQANTAEAVFYETIVEATCAEYYKASASLIQPAGWLSSLGGESVLSQEYNTHEWAMDVTTGEQLDNSAKRASWSKILTEDEAKAITVEAFLGDWDAFKDKDMTIKVPAGMGTENNMPVGSVDASKMTLTNLGADAEGKGQVLLKWKALHKSEADKYVITVTNKDVATEEVQTFEVDNATNDGEDVLLGNVTLEKTLTGLTVGSTYEVSIGTERGSGDGADKEHGTPAVKTIKVTAEEEKPDDGSLKDPENGTKFELPITLEGLLKGQKYSGGFSVTEDFYPYGKKDATTGDKKTVAGVDYALWLQGTNNPKTNGKNPGGKIPDTGAALVLDALADGVVTFICNNDGKAMSFVDATEGGDGVAILQAVKWEDKVYKFEVKKGHKYYFYAEGSKLMLCGAYVVYEGDVTDPDDEVSFDGWDKVAKPVIDSVTYASGDGDDKLTVTVKADVSDKGGTSLDVTVKKEGSTTGQTQTSKTKQTTHTFVFTVSGPGKYEVTAALKRKGQKDKITTKTVTVNANGQTVVSGGREGLYVELLDDDTDYIYTGGAIKPAIAVYNGDELLREGTDYTVKYSNNVKAAKKDSGKKAPTITVTGKGRFTGKTTQTFTIQPRDLDDVVIGGLSKDAADTLIVVENAKISPVLVYKGVVLKAGDKKDFTLTTGLNKDRPAKTDTGKEITITGVNNYTGELKLTLDVKSKSELKKISSVKIDKTAKYYDGTEQDVTITEVKAGKDVVAAEDYLIVYNGDKTSAGTQKFTVVGVGIYAGSKTSSYKINPRKATLTLTNDLEENGSVKCTFNSAGVTFNDALTVTDEGLNNAELVLGKDYKVSYSGNKKVGSNAKYTVTFLGNYKGSAAIKKTFEITAASLKDLEDAGELTAISADKAYTKPAIIKSAPYVLVNGVALKSSDYTVKYYLNEEMTTEMKGKEKVTLGADETSKTVWVKITGKKNYSGEVKTSYDVLSTTGKTDISKAKITVKDSAGKKQSKVEYDGGKAVYPYSIEIKVGKATPILLKYDADTESWVTSDGSATQDFDILVVNNIEKGKATIIVTGDGANVGSKTATFNVVSQNLKNVPAEFWSDFKDLKGLLGL